MAWSLSRCGKMQQAAKHATDGTGPRKQPQDSRCKIAYIAVQIGGLSMGAAAWGSVHKGIRSGTPILIATCACAFLGGAWGFAERQES